MKNIYAVILILFLAPPIATAQETDGIFSHSTLILPWQVERESPWSEVIKTQEQWELFYSNLLQGTPYATIGYTLPQIDFENYQVITGGVGATFSSDDFLSIKRIRELADVVLITVIYNKRRENCIETNLGGLIGDIPNYPLSTLLIKKTNKLIKFHIIQFDHGCEEY